jgi:hypothetical protein
LRIFIIDTLYASVMDRIGFFEKPLTSESFEDLTEHLNSQKFSSGAMYFRDLAAHGHATTIYYANSLKSQTAWTSQTRSMRVLPIGWKRWQLISRIPFLGRQLHNRSTKVKILLDQMREFKPDVVYCIDINFLNKQLVRKVKKLTPILVGQIASPLPPKSFYMEYDHIFSAHPKQVNHFKKLGISSSWLPLAFDQDHLKHFEQNGWPQRTRDVTFVGSFGRHQASTGPLMKAVAKLVPSLEIFTFAPLAQLKRLGLEKFLKGKAWGFEMHRVFAESKVVINRHGQVADGYAVNYRLFEATSMGAILVTEEGKNISELFEPGVEVLTYRTLEEAAEKVKMALDDYPKWSELAQAGQKRTLENHTFYHRAAQISKTLEELSQHRTR